MTGSLLTPGRRAVAEMLGRAGLDVVPRDPSEWELTWRSGGTHRMIARLEEDACRSCDWMLFEASLGKEGAVERLETNRLWDLLRWNSVLAGHVKYAVNAEGGVVLRAELPVAVDSDLSRRVGFVCQGIAEGRARYWGGVLPSPAAAAPTNAAPDLKQLCKEAGWKFEERSSGVLAVELEATHDVQHALVAAEQGQTSVSVVLAAMDADDRDCRRAVAELLLASCGRVRMARAAAVERDNVLTAQMEVVFEDTPAPFEMAAALGSLSVACNLCASETSLLAGNRDAAMEFLALRGWSAASQATNKQELSNSKGNERKRP